MKRFFLLIVMLSALFVSAGDARAQAAGAFARMGFGARGMAMSNALVADASGHASPYYNPALAPFTPRQSLEVSAALLSLDRELQFLQLASPMKPQAGIALGLIHAGVSGIDGRDNSGYHTQEHSTDEFAFFLAFGTRIGSRVTAGVGLQVFRADYMEGLKAANSIGLDVGLTARITNALRVGVVVDDLLARYTWDTSSIYSSGGRNTTDRFPIRLRIGGAYTLMQDKAQLLVEYESRITPGEAYTRRIEVVGDTPLEVTDAKRLYLHAARLRVGGAYQLSDLFALRAGIDRIGGEVSEMTPSAGFMVEQPIGRLVVRGAYAFVLEPYAVGTMHLVTLRVFL